MSAPPTPLVPQAFERSTLLYYALFAAASAAICAQINVRLGITPNTAVIGVLAAIAAGRTLLPQLRSPERQVMVETATSAGGFAGANIALVSIATLYLVGLERLVVPLVVGITAGMMIDIWLGYRLFGTRAFPAEAPWPDGQAVGRVILAGDEGGTQARELLQGVAAGVVGRLVSLPAAGLGIAFIGNPVALAALAIGLLARAHGTALGLGIGGTYVPQGLMIGAGLVQVGQTAWVVRRHSRVAAGTEPATATGIDRQGSAATRRAELVVHLAAFLAGAGLLAWLAGLWQDMPLARLAIWVAFAGASAFVHTVIVGYCAMLSGWFPSFAVAIALLLMAALVGFPLEALAMLAGYVLSTGPQFADLGYDLKSGWMVRGQGTDPVREAAGRRQQALLQEFGALVGLLTAAAIAGTYWRAGLVPPMSRVVAATIGLHRTADLSWQLAVGAGCGAAAQALGGPSRAIGILLATGLLLDNAPYGYALAGALLVRAWTGTARMSVRAPGLVAGDGLAGFAMALAGAW